MPGNRHDVQGLYALLNTTFRGHLIGDNAYWPQERRDCELIRAGIVMTANTRDGFKFQYPCDFCRALNRTRRLIERYIAQFNHQFHAARTFNRSAVHYVARRWMKALSANATKHFNDSHAYPTAGFSHLHAVA